tara:strand:+ start:206 stop:538 length:333 start_codon:yes stop_codon:yes gene_type:complete
MGNKLVSTCIPTIENRVDSYNYESEPENNKSLITIENSLAYLDESQIYFSEHTCCICMDSLSCVTLDCGHNEFCWECIRELNLKGDNRCPICRDSYQHIHVPYKLSFKIR